MIALEIAVAPWSLIPALMLVGMAAAIGELPPIWLTVKQACQVVQCGARLLYREIQAGRLRAARIGNRRDLRIHRDWIDDWLRASAEPTVQPLREVRRG